MQAENKEPQQADEIFLEIERSAVQNIVDSLNDKLKKLDDIINYHKKYGSSTNRTIPF